MSTFAEETSKIRLGHGLEAGVLCGPMLNEAARRRVARHVEDATRRGGRLILGGGPPKDERLARGFFFEPTFVDETPDGALAMTQETYGPLAAIRAVRDDREAIERANCLPYGLSAYVYSSDLERAWSFAERIEAGAVGVNIDDASELQALFGGWKFSGLGRELGREGLMAFLETRHIKMGVRAS